MTNNFKPLINADKYKAIWPLLIVPLEFDLLPIPLHLVLIIIIVTELKQNQKKINWHPVDWHIWMHSLNQSQVWHQSLAVLNAHMHNGLLLKFYLWLVMYLVLVKFKLVDNELELQKKKFNSSWHFEILVKLWQRMKELTCCPSLVAQR